GNVVLLYASVYHDVHIVINLSGRFALDRGIEGRLGRDFMQRIEKDGFIDVKDRTDLQTYFMVYLFLFFYPMVSVAEDPRNVDLVEDADTMRSI
ncbi:hypothetical protein BHE74_00034523, partial [Ensete ventricosum]